MLWRILARGSHWLSVAGGATRGACGAGAGRLGQRARGLLLWRILARGSHWLPVSAGGATRDACGAGAGRPGQGARGGRGGAGGGRGGAAGPAAGPDGRLHRRAGAAAARRRGAHHVQRAGRRGARRAVGPWRAMVVVVSIGQAREQPAGGRGPCWRTGCSPRGGRWTLAFVARRGAVRCSRGARGQGCLRLASGARLADLVIGGWRVGKRGVVEDQALGPRSLARERPRAVRALLHAGHHGRQAAALAAPREKVPAAPHAAGRGAPRTLRMLRALRALRREPGALGPLPPPPARACR